MGKLRLVVYKLLWTMFAAPDAQCLLSILISKQEITDVPLLIDTIKLPQEVFCSLLHVFIDAPPYPGMIVVIGKLYYQ
ncbi:hypothetical protein [Nostoc sp. C110]|uniref:hypothetical protein n=1 Tax=Nostoc sp. C110 TaxID=3349876 RepID=UPI00370D6E69